MRLIIRGLFPLRTAASHSLFAFKKRVQVNVGLSVKEGKTPNYIPANLSSSIIPCGTPSIYLASSMAPAAAVARLTSFGGDADTWLAPPFVELSIGVSLLP